MISVTRLQEQNLMCGRRLSTWGLCEQWFPGGSFFRLSHPLISGVSLCECVLNSHFLFLYRPFGNVRNYSLANLLLCKLAQQFSQSPHFVHHSSVVEWLHTVITSRTCSPGHNSGTIFPHINGYSCFSPSCVLSLRFNFEIQFNFLDIYWSMISFRTDDLTLVIWASYNQPDS